MTRRSHHRGIDVSILDYIRPIDNGKIEVVK